MKSLFNTRLLCGETGRFTTRARNIISEATHADFLRAVHPVLVYFVLFSPVSFFLFFFQELKVVPRTLYTGFLCDDRYQTIIYNRDLNTTEP